jgi:hypothetical protein
MGHDLLDKLTEDREQHEDGKHLILKTLLTELGFEEGETNEESLYNQVRMRLITSE